MPKPLVSVVVTTHNSSSTVEACLRSIKEQTYDNVELIVVDNNSQDSTPAIAQAYADRLVNRGPERSAQRNFGVGISNGSLLLIIDSDMVLSPGVINACVIKAQTGNVKAIVIPEDSFGEGFWAECKKLERSFYIGVAWLEAARFFERGVFEEMHGYDEENTGTEDFDLPQRIAFKYGDAVIGRVADLIHHNERRLNILGTCRKKFYYAKKLVRYESVAANVESLRLQSSPIKRYGLFFSRPLLLLANPVVGVGMVFLKTCEYASGALGYLLGKSGKRRKTAKPGRRFEQMRT